MSLYGISKDSHTHIQLIVSYTLGFLLAIENASNESSWNEPLFHSSALPEHHAGKTSGFCVVLVLVKS